MMLYRSLGIVVLLAGCTPYDPPLAGNHADAKYQSELQRCRKDVDLVISRKANATPQSLARSLFDSSDKEHADLSACMVAKGYAVQAAR